MSSRTQQSSSSLAEVVNVIQNAGIKLKDAFDAFDKDRDGFISRDEFKVAFKEMHLGLTVHEIDEMLKEIDTSRDGRISYQEFITVFRRYGYDDREQVYTRKKLRTVSELFQILEEWMSKKNIPLLKLFTEYFDVNKDAYIERKELAAGFNKLTNNPLTNSELDALMQEICHG